MRRIPAVLIAVALAAGATFAYQSRVPPVALTAQGPADLANGEYVYRLAGCEPCHTDPEPEGLPLAGGRVFETVFGRYYSSNISPDTATGIGGWSLEDFARAIRHGVGPAGQRYFPVFPYPSFTGMRDGDLRDLFAYLRTQPAVHRQNTPHAPAFPAARLAMIGWQMLFLAPGPLAPDPQKDAEWNRGAYLVRALGHCGECHTPRNRFGALDSRRHLAGAVYRDGLEDEPVPGIRNTKEDGIGGWSSRELLFFLRDGSLPDGDFVGSVMASVVDESLAYMTDTDRRALAAYLRTIPPVAP